MKFGVIGVGGIAQKAYLPTYAKRCDQGEFIFSTRNKEVQQMLQSVYSFQKVTNTMDELLDQNIEACFVHAATNAHYEIAKKLLVQGVHVFMDKPASQRLNETEELLQLAKSKNCIFMLGFNRRFAPMAEPLKQLKNKRLIMLQKNLAETSDAVAYGIYDIFIHLADTAVYLLEENIHIANSQIIEQDGKIQLATLQLATPDTHAILTMDFNSGANTETYQATSPEKTLLLQELTELQIQTASEKTVQTFGSWETTLYKRGFEQMADQFISACKTKDTSQLKQKGVLLSHQICDSMIEKHLRHEM